uniref:Uncharacterized protein n=1 Tax=Rhizophora mucronata TaxID=61149 RepID=A0A2P2IKA7_RHIMU
MHKTLTQWELEKGSMCTTLALFL